MKEEKDRQINRWPEGKVDRFLALGLSKGSVVFVTVDETDQIYTRITVHHEAIILLKEIPKIESFISICLEQRLKIWKFDFEGRNRIKYLNQVNLWRTALDVAITGESLIIAFE